MIIYNDKKQTIQGITIPDSRKYLQVNYPRLKSGACSSRLTDILTSSSNVTISYSYLHVTTSSGY